MLDSLIPFGLHKETNELVNVGSVPRGVACDCIFPCCKTPLIARQGTVKEWHFAHRSQGVHKETETLCSLSFEVSVRLMIRQISEKGGLKLRLPSYTSDYPVYCAESQEILMETMEVVTGSVQTLLDVDVGVNFCDVVTDVVGDIGGVPFAIYVTYEKRPYPLEYSSPRETKCGILGIRAEKLYTAMRSVTTGRYIEALTDFLANDTDGKYWIYHPRIGSAETQANEVLEKYGHIRQQRDRDRYITPEYPQTRQKSFFIPPPRELPTKDFECRMCGTTWTSPSHECPKCKNHYYAVEVNDKST